MSYDYYEREFYTMDPNYLMGGWNESWNESWDLANGSLELCEEPAGCGGEPCDGGRGGARGLALPAFHCAVFLLGGCSNGLVLAVLLRRRGGRGLGSGFLLHLTLADLLLAAGLPFWAAEEIWGWTLGRAACKLLGALYNVSFYTSLYLLVCISFERYLAVARPVQTYRRRRPARIWAVCLAVWTVSLLLALPDFLFLRPVPVDGPLLQCIHYFGSGEGRVWVVTWRGLYHVSGFALPLVAMGYCHARIAHAVLRANGARGGECRANGVRRRRGERANGERRLGEPSNEERRRRWREWRAVRLMAAVAAAFLVCWSPYNGVLLADTLHRLGALPRGCTFERRLDAAYVLTGCLAQLHCCLNPLLYAFVGVRFRQELLGALRAWGLLAQAPHLDPGRSRSRNHTLTGSELLESSASCG